MANYVKNLLAVANDNIIANKGEVDLTSMELVIQDEDGYIYTVDNIEHVNGTLYVILEPPTE